jgi:hypothetical protein
MRLALALTLISSTALADSPYKLAEEAALGMDLPGHPLLDADFSTCKDAPGAPLFWVEVSKAGKVSAAHVHGAGKLDACFEHALAKAKVADKLPASIVVVGHIDVDGQAAPRVSQAPVVLDAHHAKWQISANQIHYTANRMMDIAAALDAASDAVSNCAGKRDKPGKAMIWHANGGKPIMRSGAPGYDDCVTRALASVKFPAPESAYWIAADVTPPGEQLAAHTDDPHLSHEQALKDAVSTAVRAHKLDYVDCENAHPKAGLTAVTVTLYGAKLTTKKVTATDAAIEACVKSKVDGLKIPNASPSDKLELEVDLTGSI